MKTLILATILYIFTFTHALGQTTHDSSWTATDSSGITEHDSTPAMNLAQTIHYVFENLSTTPITTGILIDRSIPLINYNVHKGDTNDFKNK